MSNPASQSANCLQTATRALHNRCRPIRRRPARLQSDWNRCAMRCPWGARAQPRKWRRLCTSSARSKRPTSRGPCCPPRGGGRRPPPPFAMYRPGLSGGQPRLRATNASTAFFRSSYSPHPQKQRSSKISRCSLALARFPVSRYAWPIYSCAPLCSAFNASALR